MVGPLPSDRVDALLQPLSIGPRTAPNRVMFGPIVTNLGDDDRMLTSRHTAFYRRRAEGGCGIIVTEEASVHVSDWPYERSPLAERCSDGWSAIVNACRPHDSLVVAALGHAGGQGSSAYNQRELWAPSRVPEVNAREVPKWMEADDIAAVIVGFEQSARLAVGAGCDGVEVNAGQHSLVRQFLSGLTNHRDDEWGTDRLAFARAVLAAVRRGVGAGALVGLRLSCDELAPWAGITPEQAPALAAALCEKQVVDYLVVTRGSIFSVEKTRADFHEPAMVNAQLCRSVKAAVTVPVFLQGAVVELDAAAWAVDSGAADGVEMTRAQLADPDLVRKRRDGGSPRPCIRCNQVCQVRDARNPIISCVVEPSTGYEDSEPSSWPTALAPRFVLVVGGGPAGLEAARVASMRGHNVRLVEQREALGGMAAVAGPGRPFIDWQIAECDRLGVEVVLGSHVDHVDSTALVATGSQRGRRGYDVGDGAVVVDIAELRHGEVSLPDDGTVVIYDPIGGPIAVALAEQLGDRAILVTQDNIAGNELARTGDLAPANTRLAQRGVTIERRSLVRAVRAGEVELEDRFGTGRRIVVAAAFVDCGFRLPADALPGADDAVHIGDCVAPRTILEAVLEGRRAAASL